MTGRSTSGYVVAVTPGRFPPPRQRFPNLPGADFPPDHREVDGLRLHYVDEGPKSGRPIVCFHGEPSWAYLYRKMIGPFVETGTG